MRSIEEKRARGIVALEWVLITLASLLIATAGIYYLEDIKKIFSGDDEIATIKLKAYCIIIVAAVVVNVLLTLVLTNGVHGRHTCSCKTWYIFHIIAALLGVIGLVQTIMELNLVGSLIRLFVLIYRVCAIKFIMAYSASLTSNSPELVNEQRGHAPSSGARVKSKRGNLNVV